MASIVSSLGVGTGIDTRALIDSLVDADRQARTKPLTRRQEALTAQISALGQVQSALQGIASSLSGRVTSGVLGLQPASSDTGVLAVERRGTGPLSAFNSSLSISALASGQRLIAAPLASADAPVGQGVLSFGFGRRTALPDGSFSFATGSAPPLSITIGPDNNSLTGLRDAINRSNGPVTASIITNASGATLTLRGRDGADYAFVASAAETPGQPGLSRFAYTPGDPRLMLSTSAADAELVLDGVSVRRSSNSIDDLVTGTRLTLRRTGSVTLSAARDTAALATTVSDFAETLAAMRALIGDFRKSAAGSEVAGALATDPTARALDQRIAGMLTMPVAAADGLRLRDIGITADRTGAISFNPETLAALPANRQGDAEALLRNLAGPAFAQPAGLQALAAQVTPASSGLTRRKDSVTSELAKVEARLAAYRDVLTRQYAAMDRLVAESKAVGSQLDQQIKIWTNSDNR